MTLSRAKELGLPTKADLFEFGYLRAGMVIQVLSAIGSDAVIVSKMKVSYNGQELSFNAWGKLVTGWPSISLFSRCRIKDGPTFYELRRQLIAERREALS
jgi:hypothetical protein